MIIANHLNAAACKPQPGIFHHLIFHPSRGLNIHAWNCVTLFQDIPIIKLIFNSDQRVFCCLTDGRVQVDEEQRRRV